MEIEKKLESKRKEWCRCQDNIICTTCAFVEEVNQ